MSESTSKLDVMKDAEQRNIIERGDALAAVNFFRDNLNANTKALHRVVVENATDACR